MSSPRDIENDIEHTRAHLDGTIDAIAAKLSPMQMISQVLAFTKAGGGELAGSIAGGLATAARDNPVPVTLLTLGAGLLAMNNRESRGNGRERRSGEWMSKTRERVDQARARVQTSAQETTHRLEEKMQTTAQDTQAKAREMMDRAQAKTEDMRRQLHETRDTAVNAAQENIAHLQDAANRLLETNPIAAGALMVAIGALVGGALPATERERQLFGRTGEKVRDTAMSAMQRGTEAVKEIAEKTLEETKQTVEKVGEESRHPQPAIH